MSLADFVERREKALITKLEEKRSAIDDRTGKGLATEQVIEDELIMPLLQPRFGCTKGAIVSSKNADDQSKAIDRVVFDKTAAPPLVYDKAHSIFPIECVCGLIEITMRLDASKLRCDIERMAPIKSMTTGRYLISVPGTRTLVIPHEENRISPRSFVIGLPADEKWHPKTIGNSLREIQMSLGSHTHVHGLYVIGIGFFETVPIEQETDPKYRIGAWTGLDRLFRFSNSFRQAFDRWGILPRGWTVDLSMYLNGAPEIIAE